MGRKHIWQQYVAEFIGTFFLVLFGCGAMVLREVTPNSMYPFIIPVVFGGVVSVMIYAVGHISGAHFNPAVTIAFWINKKFPLYRLPGYLAAQFSGALLGSFVHFFIWGSAHSFGATSLSVGIGVGVLVEFLLSFILMFVIIAVATDSRAIGELAGIAIGSTVALCAFVGGPLTGASMNPARSLAPAILTGQFSYLWIYLFVTVGGALAGGFVYERIRCDISSDDAHGCC